METVNYNHLYYFHVVAEEGSLTAAARVLHVTKPTISAQIRQLEDFLGAPLFERRGGRMRLNPAGRAAFRHTETMFEAGRALLRHFRRQEADPRRTLRVGVGPAVSRTIAADFFEPLVELEGAYLRIQQERARDLRAVQTFELDVLLTAEKPSDPASQGLAVTRLERSPVIAVVGDGREPLPDLPTLLRERHVVHHGHHSSLHWRIDAWLQDRGMRARADAHIDDVATMVAMVMRSDALAFVPRTSVSRLLEAGELREAAALEGLAAEVHAVYVERDVPELVTRAVELLRRP